MNFKLDYPTLFIIIQTNQIKIDDLSTNKIKSYKLILIPMLLPSLHPVPQESKQTEKKNKRSECEIIPYKNLTHHASPENVHSPPTLHAKTALPPSLTPTTLPREQTSDRSQR